MKQIDGIDEDKWFELRAADVVERMIAQPNVPMIIHIEEVLAPHRELISKAIDPITADISKDIVRYMVLGAYNEKNGDLQQALAWLRAAD